MVSDERSGLLYAEGHLLQAMAHRRYRTGIQDVWNMDSRAGGITEKSILACQSKRPARPQHTAASRQPPAMTGPTLKKKTGSWSSVSPPGRKCDVPFHVAVTGRRREKAGSRGICRNAKKINGFHEHRRARSPKAHRRVAQVQMAFKGTFRTGAASERTVNFGAPGLR